MLIGTTAVDTAGEFKVEKPLHAIAIVMRMVDADIVPNLDSDPRNLLNLLHDENIVIDVRVQDKNGNTTRQFTQLPLLPLLENETANDNHMVAVTDGTTLVVKGYLPFSDEGSLPFNDDETMTISFSASNFALTVYGYDHPVAGGTFKKIETVTVQQGQKDKEWDCDGWSTVLIKLTDITDTTKIVFYHTNGKNIEYTREEIENLGLLSNEVCMNFDGRIKSGFGRYASIDVRTCTKIALTRASSSSFDFFVEKENIHKDIQKSQVQNQRLKDTTHIRKMNYAQKFIKA